MQERTRLARKVILISVDGMRPDFYLDERFPCPLLRSLAAQGVCARAATPVYPTVTMTNHATIATGVGSVRHGILANTVFDESRVKEWLGGESQDWYMSEHQFRHPPIWKPAEEAGLRCAVLRWPVSQNAQASWVVPETFSPVNHDPNFTWELTMKSMEPSLAQEFGAMIQASRNFPQEKEGFDEWLTDCAIHLLRHENPDLIMIHFLGPDHAAHEHGKDSPELFEALKRTEGRISRLLRHLDLEDSSALIFGDHGFMDFQERVHVNSLFKKAGWIQTTPQGNILDWQVIAHTNCAQAGIYLRDPTQLPEVEALLQLHSAHGYQIIRADELKHLGCLPGASLAVDCLRGFSMGQNLDGELIERIPKPRGEHGYLPTHPEMQAGWIGVGAGLKTGKILDKISLCDIAPTTAKLLGFSLGDVDGEVIREALAA